MYYKTELSDIHICIIIDHNEDIQLRYTW